MKRCLLAGAIILALCCSGCTGKGSMQKRVYLDSNNTNKAYIGYDLPIN